MSDLDATFLSLKVNAKGEALVTYRRRDGKVRHVLVWGALNAVPPSDQSVRQVRFSYDYAGGWGKYRKASYWKTFRNACTPYDGPPLVYFVLRVQGAGRHLLGDSALAARTPAPRLRAVVAIADVRTSCTSPTGRASSRSSRSTPTGRTAGSGRGCSVASPTSATRSSASARPAQGNPFDRYGRNVYIDTLQLGLRRRLEARVRDPRPQDTRARSATASCPQKPFPDYPSKAMRPPGAGRALPRHRHGRRA